MMSPLQVCNLRQTYFRRLGLLVTVLLFVGLVACGGGGEEGAPPGSSDQATQSESQSSDATNGGGSAQTVDTPDVASEESSDPTGESAPDADAPASQDPAVMSTPPPVDTSIASVPLDDVVFDLFSGGSFARLSEASPNLIERLRDAIQPIYQPRYEGAQGGDWLKEDDLVMGYVGESEAYAYPIKMLNFHEMVNEVIDGIPLLVSYCPLCTSGVVYDRRLDDRVLKFGNTSALYENDLVMFDYETGSFWFQVGGEAIVGELTGSRLEILPATTMTWSQWKELHPDTRILSRDQPDIGQAPPYARDPFAGGGYEERLDQLEFPFPTSSEKVDARLRPSEIVLSIKLDDVEKAYPLGRLGDGVVNDTVSDQPVVIFSRAEGPNGAAFSRELEERTLDFALESGRFVDEQTGSTWDLSGRSTAGELQGRQLKLLPGRRAFWFSLSLAVPDVVLHEVPE